MVAAKSKKAVTPTRLWLLRGLIAVVAGVSIGAGGGVFSVHKLEPGRGTGVDSLQVMLDSIAKGRIPAPTATAEVPVSPPADDTADTADSVATPSTQELVLVPSVVDLEEGTARNAILDAGLQVGEVSFQASTKPAGTVLGTTPVAGAQVPALTAVSLLLSDGRPPATPNDAADAPRRSPLLPTP